MGLLHVYVRCLKILWFEEREITVSLGFTALFVGAIQAIEPVLFGRVIDSLGGQSSAWRILALWAALSFVNILSSVYLAVVSDRLAHRQRLNILDQVFERAIALPLSYHSEHGSGRVVHSILAGADQLFNLWLSFLREHLSALIGVICLVPLATTLDRRMAVLLFGLAVVFVTVNFLLVKRTHRLQEQIQDHHQSVFSQVGDVIGNVTVVQSYVRLVQEIQALQRINAELLRVQYPVVTWWGILSVITRVSSAVTMVIILGLGSYLVSRGELTVGAVVSFASFSGLLIGRLDQLSGFVSQLIARGPALNNFFRLLDQSGAALDRAGAKPIQNVRGEVEFKNVTFRHKNSPSGVFDLNFRVEAGQTVALVGPSGSGKTTTLALMQRLFDPETGLITLDGEDIRDVTVSSLRHAIATVFQDSGLFNRSIMDNIRVGKPEASDEDVYRAAEQAQAHEFIMRKEGGYGFVIGERGASLSGGERQRIAIARAILKNAPILIFDEATSALDNRTEKAIQHAITALRSEKKTTFIIAHRLSTVTSADHILVFDRGRIVEAGTFDELKRREGIFRGLLTLGEVTTSDRHQVLEGI